MACHKLITDSVCAALANGGAGVNIQHQLVNSIPGVADGGIASTNEMHDKMGNFNLSQNGKTSLCFESM